MATSRMIDIAASPDLGRPVTGSLAADARWVDTAIGWAPPPALARRCGILAQYFARDIWELDMFARMLGIGGV